MYIDNKTVTTNEDWRRVSLLLSKAFELGINVSGLNIIYVDEVTKEVRFYPDDFDFKLVVALGSNTVQACTGTSYRECYVSIKNKSLKEINKWSKKIKELKR